MTKLVIFDLDGTLLDTLGDLANACNHALARCGYPPHGKDAYRHFVGKGIMNLFRSALPEDSRDDVTIERMREYFIPYYNEHKCDITQPYPGIISLLDRLTGSGIMIAVASNKYQEGTEQLVERFFGEYDFAAVLGQRDGMPIKPDAGIIYEAMRLAGDVTAEETVYCGDSDVDMMTGRNAGVRTIGVTWGFREREELEAYSPWMTVDDPCQIFASVTDDLK